MTQILAAITSKYIEVFVAVSPSGGYCIVTPYYCYAYNWWENISGIKIKNSSVLNECIIFGFPGDSDVIEVLNYCVLYAKYYI